jgi:ubiquinone biosynthesis protein UbiJ
MSFMKIEVQQACLALLEQAINRYIELDPDYSQKLAPLYGSIIEIELTGIGLRIYLRTDSKGIICQGSLEGEPDCVIKGTPIGLMKMSLGEKGTQTKGLFSGEVEISGDIQLGQKMNQVLDSIDIDWEEHLSHITGDVVAYRVGQVFKQSFAWMQESTQQMRDNVRDYFIYESEDVPHPTEVNQFVTQIDTLRDDVARAEARLQEIVQKMKDNVSK